jgi:hypothetical protein
METSSEDLNNIEVAEEKTDTTTTSNTTNNYEIKRNGNTSPKSLIKEKSHTPAKNGARP